jgi:hypothetical protein
MGVNKGLGTMMEGSFAVGGIWSEDATPGPRLPFLETPQ